MSEQSSDTQHDESVSVEITEADFSDAGSRAAAIQKLIDMTAQNSGADNGGADGGLERPHISALRAVLNVVIPLAVAAALFCALYFTVRVHRLAISLGVSLGALGLYIILRLRDILIWSILMYQRFAPAEVRNRCVFTPTCSQYALQALRRYGVIRGVPKIISRLWRCHPPNGGDDPLK